MPSYVGVDIGKTKVSAARISNKGEILEKSVMMTDLRHGGKGINAQVESLVKKMVRSDTRGIGISSIGIVDSARGIVIKSSIEALNGLPLRDSIGDKFGLPVAIDNDLHGPAFGEYIFGAGKGSPLLVYLTISTGAGISTIRDGRIEHGAHNLAGFIGNAMVLPDGNDLESRFSGAGISQRTSKALGRAVTTEEAFKLAKDKSSPARKVIKEARFYAAAVVATIQMSIDPERIVVGGSVATNQPRFIEHVKRTADKMVGPGAVQLPNGINLVVSTLGQYNGVLGAAALVMQKHQD